MLLFLLFFVTVRGQEQCIRKEGNTVTTDTYKVIAKKESATSIDLCEKECIKVYEGLLDRMVILIRYIFPLFRR